MITLDRTAHETTRSPSAARVLEDASMLSTMGQRHDGDPLAHAHLQKAADRIEARFASARWSTRREPFAGERGRRVENVIAERRGAVAPEAIVVLGAHYDSIRGGPGADDNATGVAALLAIADGLGERLGRTVRLVAFTNEEHPHTRTRTMGSLVHARACREAGDRIVAMLSLESLGFHVQPASPRRGDLTLLQRLVPLWTEGTFVVTDLRSRALGRVITRTLRPQIRLPVRRIVAPRFLPLVKSSDHWAFWKNGYRAAMLTDAAPLRYRHYHRPTDTIDRVSSGVVAAIAEALLVTVAHLATPSRDGGL
jgi:hypothetical protein